MTTVTFTITPMDFITALNAALPCADKSKAYTTSSHMEDVALWVRSDGGLSFISTNRYVSAVINSTAPIDEDVPNGLLATVSPTNIKILATWFRSIPSYRRTQEATVTLGDDKLTIEVEGYLEQNVHVSRDSDYPAIARLVDNVVKAVTLGGIGSVGLDTLTGIAAVAKVLSAETIQWYAKEPGGASVATLTVGPKARHGLTGSVVFMQRRMHEGLPDSPDIWATR